jgi:hypothetical protein
MRVHRQIEWWICNCGFAFQANRGVLQVVVWWCWVSYGCVWTCGEYGVLPNIVIQHHRMGKTSTFHWNAVVTHNWMINSHFYTTFSQKKTATVRWLTPRNSFWRRRSQWCSDAFDANWVARPGNCFQMDVSAESWGGSRCSRRTVRKMGFKLYHQNVCFIKKTEKPLY